MTVHNAGRATCPDAPRTEPTRWSNEVKRVTCATCKGG